MLERKGGRIIKSKVIRQECERGGIQKLSILQTHVCTYVHHHSHRDRKELTKHLIIVG